MDEAATLKLGADLAQGLTPGLVVHLAGDLGAGKTTLVRGVLRGLGFEGNVKSPTYTLVEVYPVSSLNLHHFDFYRLIEPEEYLDAGLDEYFHSSAVCLVEWPERAGGYVAPPDVQIELRVESRGRRAGIRACSAAGRECIERLSLRRAPP